MAAKSSGKRGSFCAYVNQLRKKIRNDWADRHLIQAGGVLNLYIAEKSAAANMLSQCGECVENDENDSLNPDLLPYRKLLADFRVDCFGNDRNWFCPVWIARGNGRL
jgi:hypothetical protein